jgi:predicted Zn finger-like uncharacterized protein
MSLATRCTACDTVFRVVQDQLKVSEGWVRCGRCQEVFNALEGLFDLEPEPAAIHPSALPEAPPGEAELPLFDPAPWPSEVVTVATEPAEPSFEEPHRSSRPAGFDATPASRVAARDRIDFADARFNRALLAEDGIEIPDEQPESASTAGAAVATPAPEFLRQAERQARWERPRTVVALSALCVLLVLAMALQAAVHFRDLLAAVAPPVRPALEALCEMVACRIEPLRRIDDVVIESSALTSATQGDAVRLSVVLRNRGPLPLAMPSVELTLTDPGGQMLVRRALSPSDFGVTDPALPAASESTLQLVMSTGDRRASGYTVEPFYP